MDPYTAAAQAAYLQPGMGGGGAFGGGFVGSPTDFGMASGGGFGMGPLQLDHAAQLQLMQGQLSQMSVSGNGGEIGGGGPLGANGQSGPFDQLSSLGVFVSAPTNGRLHP